MNAENPVQIDLFGASATSTKYTTLAENNGGSRAVAMKPVVTFRAYMRVVLFAER